MRPCRCADPENCTEPIPGMVCRGSRGHATNGEPPEILAGDFVLLDGLGWRPVFTPREASVLAGNDAVIGIYRAIWMRAR